MVVPIFAVLPEFVKPGAPNNQSRVELHSIRPEAGILKVFLESFEISLNSHIGQVRHYMSDHFERTVLSQAKAFLDRLNRMPTIGVSGDIFIDALDSNLQSGAAIGKQVRQMRLLAEVRSCFNCDANTLRSTLLRELDGFLMGCGDVTAQSIMQIFNEVVPVLFV